METGNTFVSSHENILNQFGKFTSDDEFRILYICQQQLFYFISRFRCIARKVYALKETSNFLFKKIKFKSTQVSTSGNLESLSVSKIFSAANHGGDIFIFSLKLKAWALTSLSTHSSFEICCPFIEINASESYR